MQKKNQFIILLSISSILLLSTSLLFMNVGTSFPDFGGFTRHILLINSDSVQPGYCIVIDEIDSKVPSSQIEIFYHGRGDLNVNYSVQLANWTTSSYLNHSQNVSLLLQYFTPVESISIRQGLAARDSTYESCPYISVKIPQNTKMAAAILYPVNNSMSNPNFSRDVRSSWINDHDFVRVQDQTNLFTQGNVTSDAKILFFRVNSSNNITSYFVKDCTTLIYNGFVYLDIIKPQTIAWNENTTQNSNIKSITKIMSSHEISSSISISKPSLYFNLSSLPALRQKMQLQSPWKEWFNNLEASSQSYLTSDINSIDPVNRADAALKLAYLSCIDENATYLNRVKEYLSAIPTITGYSAASEYLRRSIATMRYVLALDMIHPNISTSERQEYESNILSHSKSLFDTFLTTPRNNHILIRSGAFGLLGLYFNESSWIQTALNEIDRYLNENIRSEGACYEGQSYEGYGFLNVLRFLYALYKTTNINYFTDVNFERLLLFNVNSTSPLGTLPLFEDARHNSEVAEMCLWSAPHISEGKYLQWLFEQRNASGSFNMMSPTVSRLVMYDTNVVANAPTWNASIIARDSGLAFLRDSWRNDSLYLAFNSKTYKQSHTHLDQNSIEFWAYGAYLLANPGYGTFGDEHHGWLISTESSNTLSFNGKDQLQETAEGIQDGIISEGISYVSGSAYQTYVHPSSFTMHPSFFNIFIAIYVVIIACIVLGFLLIKSTPEKIEIKKSNNPEKSQSLNTWKDEWRMVYNNLFFRNMSISDIDNGLGVRTNKISFWMNVSIIVLMSYLILTQFHLIINPYLATYSDPSLSYSSVVNSFYIIEIILFILIGPILVLSVWLFRRSFYYCFNKYFNSSFPLSAESRFTLKSLDFIGLPLILYWIFACTWIFLFVFPIFSGSANELLTNTGSIIGVINELVEFVAHCMVHVIILFVILAIISTWMALMITRYVSIKIDVSKKQVFGRILLVSLLIFSIFLILLILFYTILINYLGTLQIADLM
ncbi:MAG: heparinase II/III domain-containing protein [Candidatus Helarchaeota archaeon]